MSTPVDANTRRVARRNAGRCGPVGRPGDVRRSTRAASAGSAAVDYLGIVAVIAIMVVGLVMLRPQRTGPKSPVNPITPIIRLLGRPLQDASPATPARRPGVRTPAPRRHPARPRADRSPVTVLLPEWWDR